VLSVEQDGARNTARWLALVGMARDLAAADVNAVRTGIGTELRKLYSDVLREEIPQRMAELIKQLDQLMEAKPRNRSTDDP
jgi:Anti-sigma factor NepR